MVQFKKWDKKVIEDLGGRNSKDYEDFCHSFKIYLWRTFENADVIGFEPGHYDTCGFLRFDDGRCVYIHYAMERYATVDGNGYHDFSKGGPLLGVQFRSAKDVHDYVGGVNNFCSMYELKSELTRFLTRWCVPA